MEKIIGVTLGVEGVLMNDALCGGVQGEHRATVVEFTPDVELSAKIAEYKASGSAVELHISAALSSGETVGKEERAGEELFTPFYLTEEMTSPGLDITLQAKLFIVGEDVKEICKGQITLYFVPSLAEEFITTCNEQTECPFVKQAEETLSVFDETASRFAEVMDTKVEAARTSAETAARHLKQVEEISKETQNTKATLENGMELSVLGGGADAVLPLIPEAENRLLMRGVFGYREDTNQNWHDINPVLQKGEPSVVRDGQEGKWLKIGDGITPWRELPFMMGPKGEKGADAECDLTYSPTSSNAQSGIAVAEAFALKNFELLSDITLTEEVREVCWTQTDSGETLGNYKDFFIYFLGSFTNAATNEFFHVRANDGTQYFMHTGVNKSTNTRGIWCLIENIANTDKVDANPNSTEFDGLCVFKATFPKEFLTNVTQNAGDIMAQGLSGNNKQLYSNLSIVTLKRTVTGRDFSQFKNLYIGQASTATSIFATGSRFLLFGRKA